MTNLPATQKKEVVLADYLASRSEDFKAVMPVKPDRFLRLLNNAILRDPKIAEASTRSVYLEVMKAAQDGLVLDGREATLTRFNSKDGVQVVYIPMVSGIMKRVRNSGEIQAWTCEVVYAKEYESGKFKYTAAPEPMLSHEPIIVGERGEVVAVYSAVRLKDGTYHYEVMTIDQVRNIMNRTRSKTRDGRIVGPWASDFEEMARKTVIRRHAKRLPVSSDVLDVTSRVDDLYDSNVVEHEETPQEPRKTAAEKMAEAMQQEPVDTETHDEETGEILEGEVIEDAVVEEINPEDDF